MANSFFKNGDKAYSENLNDGILVGNAFDWTVDISLPDDTGAVFPNSSTVVKAKVADVSITPNSNLSIGSTISNSSGSSQVYRLTVYPNFNRFGGFKSITLDGDGTIYIANKGATTPIANNLDYDDLGNVPELQVLKEYDIVVTIPNNGEVTGLGFVFQSSGADVSGSINQSNISGLTSRLNTIESKDTQQDGRLTALEEVDDGVFFYQVYASDYNPSIDSSVIVYCKCTDIAGSAVSGKSLTLYQNGTSVSASITNNDGVASWTITLSDWDIHHFNVHNVSLDIKANGWRIVKDNEYEKVQYNEDTAQVILHTESIGFGTSWSVQSASILGSAKSLIKPSMPVISLNYGNSFTALSIKEDGELWKKSYTGSSVTTGAYCLLEWHYR